MHKIMSQTGIDCLRIVLCLQLRVIDAHKLFAAARILAKTIVGNAVKPCGKLRFPTKAANVLVSAEKSLLRQIVCQSDVRARELAKQPAHARLMPPHQFAERVLIVITKNSRDEVRISELHVTTLWYRWRRRDVLLAFQFPHEEIPQAD